MSGSPTFDERFQQFAPPTSAPPPFANQNAPFNPPPTAESALATNDNSLSLGKEHFLREQQQALDEQKQTTQQILQMGQQEVGALRQNQARMQPLYDAMAKAFVIPQPPEPTKIPKAPTLQDAQAQDPNHMWLTAAMLLGTLGGSLTRRPLTNALSAFSGVIEGYNTGQNQNFEKLSKEWEMANKQALEAQAQADKRYQQILDSTKLGMEQKQIAIQLEGMRQKDEAMISAAKMKTLEVAAQLQDVRAKQAGDMAKAIEAKETEMARAKYQRETQLQAAQIRAGAAGGNRQSDEALDLRAQMMLDGNLTAATKGMGVRSPDWPILMDKFAAAAKAAGMSADDIMRKQQQFTGEAAYQRSTATMAGRIEVASNEVEEVAPLAIEASRHLDRGEFVPLNKVIQEGIKTPAWAGWLTGVERIPIGQKDFSDTRYYDFVLRNYSLIKAYARAMNPQGVPRVEDAKHAGDLLSTATSQQAYAIQVRAIFDEIAASKRAVAKARQGVSTGESAADRLGLPHATDADPNNVNTLPTMSWGDKLNSLLPGWKVAPTQ